MKKPEYISSLEKKTEEIFSILSSDSVIEKSVIEKMDKNKNMVLVHIDAEFTQDRIRYNSKLYKTSNGFYIYCKTHLGTGWDSFEVSIYHKPEHLNEVIIFLKQLNK